MELVRIRIPVPVLMLGCQIVTVMMQVFQWEYPPVPGVPGVPVHLGMSHTVEMGLVDQYYVSGPGEVWMPVLH